ncbi:MAG: flagellar biosynthesis protein [Clostridia bacterium]|nr:flagellar biosynthesis protein [Clostridia bacterium]
MVKEGVGMIINNKIINNVGRIQPTRPLAPVQKSTPPAGDFSKILESKINEKSEIKFSKHAEARLQTRNIQLTEVQKEKINNAVKRAEEKGVRDSLVLVDDIALVVNVKNKTVITAVSSNELKENVFTNIDGAVFA